MLYGGLQVEPAPDLRCSATLLVTKQDKVGSAANSKFAQQVRYVKFHSSFGDIELVPDLLVGQVLQQRIQHFLFAAAQIGGRVSLQAAAVRPTQDGVDKTGEYGARNPESSIGDQRQCERQLLPGFFIGKQPLRAHLKQ